MNSPHWHSNQWDDGSHDGGCHVFSSTLWVNTFHVDINIIQFHFEVYWCQFVIHTSVELVLGTISGVCHDSTNAAHFLHGFSTTVSGSWALWDLWSSWDASLLNSILEVSVELNSGLSQLMTISFVLFRILDVISISFDSHFVDVAIFTPLSIGSR